MGGIVRITFLWKHILSLRCSVPVTTRSGDHAVDAKNGKIVTTAFVFCLDEMCRETLPPIAWQSVAKHDKASHIQLQVAGNT